MSSEHSLATVVAFDKMPETPEKKEISRKFLASEISSYEFYVLCSAYMKAHSPETSEK